MKAQTKALNEPTWRVPNHASWLSVAVSGWVAIFYSFGAAGAAEQNTAGGAATAKAAEGAPAAAAPMPGMDMEPKPAAVTLMPGMDMSPSPAPATPKQAMEMESTPTPAASMDGMDMESKPAPGTPMKKMDMGSMQGGNAPANARDPDAYSEGYAYTDMPGMEHTDQIRFGHLLPTELEYLSGNEGEGFNWTIQGNYGGDHDKLWLRTQGQKIESDPLDPTTDAEALWWRAWSPFWGTQLGVRQDFGRGAHTYLAAGVEGLAPRWFDIEATGYVGEDGRFSARFKASYDARFTNRLILTPGVESNAYSKSDNERGLGAGLGNIEAGLRMRYELHRKFAPYVGYVWEWSFAGTADRRRAEGSPVNERRFVAGIRVWW